MVSLWISFLSLSSEKFSTKTALKLNLLIFVQHEIITCLKYQKFIQLHKAVRMIMKTPWGHTSSMVLFLYQILFISVGYSAIKVNYVRTFEIDCWIYNILMYTRNIPRILTSSYRVQTFCFKTVISWRLYSINFHGCKQLLHSSNSFEHILK